MGVEGFGRFRLELGNQGCSGEKNWRRCCVRERMNISQKNTNKEDKCKIFRIEMELKLGKRIEDLQFVAEENYQTNIM